MIKIRLSFRQRQFLTLLVLAIVPPILVLSTALPIIQNFVIQRTTNQLEIVADLKAGEVETWINRGREVGGLISASILKEMLERRTALLASGPAIIESDREDFQIWIQVAAELFPQVRSISLLHPVTGQILLSTDPTLEGRERADERFFQEGQQALYVSPVVYSVGREAPILNIAAPVKDSSDLLSVVVVEMNLEDLENTLSNRTGLGETGRAYLVEAYGFYVTLSPDRRSPLRALVDNEGVRSVLKGQDGHSTYADSTGEQVLGVYRWLQDADLGLLVEIEQSELISQYTHIWELVIAAELALLVIAIIVALRLAGWLVSPLERIVVTAQTLRAGNLSRRTQVDGPDEIQQLALAFNKMAESLQQSYENLEQLVEQRTHELTKTNAQLRQEISERKRAQEELSSSEQRYRTLFEDVPVALMEEDWSAVRARFEELRAQGIADCEAYFVDHPEDVLKCASLIKFEYNQAALELYQTNSEAMPKEGTISIMLPEVQEVIRKVFAALANGQLTYEDESVILTRTGEKRHVIMRLSVAPGHETTWSKVLVSLNDITERKQIEQRIREVNDKLEQRVLERTAELESALEEVRRFAYIVSHDMRTPLVNIKGFAAELHYSLDNIKTLLDSVLLTSDDEQRTAIMSIFEQDVPEAITYIDTSVSRMDYLINAVLRLSRMGRSKLMPETINMDSLVRDALQTLAHQISSRGVDVQIQPLGQITADRTAMTQIISNILTNAVNYLSDERPGKITIRSTQAEDATTFYIQDNGRGIARDDFHKVFELFRRAGRQTVDGEGMGMTYVQMLVRRHGGRIWFESELGVGTTFMFTIPYHLPADPSPVQQVLADMAKD